MKRSVYSLKAGNIANLKMKEETIAPPSSNEVMIKVKSIGLNFADIFAIWGLYSATPKGEFIPGLEYAGEIIHKGDAVDGYEIGDRVMGITRFGGYATHINIDSRYISKIPKEWTYQEGAAYLVHVLTAYYGLIELGNIQKNATVLIHSAAGGVGIQAIRIAKKYDAFILGSIGSSHKIQKLKEEGCDVPIVRTEHFSKDLKQALDGRPLNLIMECIGGKILQEGFKQLSPEGRMIVYGSAQYASPGLKPNYLKMMWKYWRRPKIDPLALTNSNRSLMGFNLIWLYKQVEKMHKILHQLESFHLPPPHVGHEFLFDDLKEGVRLFQKGQTIGKVVVNIH